MEVEKRGCCQPRAESQPRLFAGVLVLVVIRIALVGVVIVVRVGIHVIGPFYVRGSVIRPAGRGDGRQGFRGD